MNYNKTKKSNSNTKEPYTIGLYNKPTLELVEPGVPLNLKTFQNTKCDAPILIDPEHNDKVYMVENEQIYIVRLGIHSSSFGIGAFDKNTAVICSIPTRSTNCHSIMALFSNREIYPITYADLVCLRSEHRKPFRLEYMLGSAMLESNNNSQSFTLSNDTVHIENETLFIRQNGLNDKISNFCSFAFDFITLQVRVVFDKYTS